MTAFTFVRKANPSSLAGRNDLHIALRAGMERLSTAARAPRYGPLDARRAPPSTLRLPAAAVAGSQAPDPRAPLAPRRRSATRSFLAPRSSSAWPARAWSASSAARARRAPRAPPTWLSSRSSRSSSRGAGDAVNHYTLSRTGCRCAFDASSDDCACCANGGVPCGGPTGTSASRRPPRPQAGRKRRAN